MSKRTTIDRICNEFYQLILDKGFYGISINVLAAKVGISKASFYHYTTSKIDFVQKVLLSPDYYGFSLLPFKLRFEDSVLLPDEVLSCFPKVKEFVEEETNITWAAKALFFYSDKITIREVQKSFDEQKRLALEEK